MDVMCFYTNLSCCISKCVFTLCMKCTVMIRKYSEPASFKMGFCFVFLPNRSFVFLLFRIVSVGGRGGH